MNEKYARSLIKTMLSTINYYHDKGIVHRDIKPQNILLEADLDWTKIKLIDFGTAGPYDKSGKRQLSDQVGTPYYIAPEVLEGKYN